jgi:hypothetical protein
MDLAAKMNQLDFYSDFETADLESAAAQRLWKAKHDLIDQSAASKRVKMLLHALADFPRSIGGERGVSHVTADVDDIGSRIGKVANTVRNYLKAAYETPYLELLNPQCTNAKRTYVIHWHAIFDRDTTAPNKRSPVVTPEDVTKTDKRCPVGVPEDGQKQSPPIPQGGQISPPRGSISKPEPLNLRGSGAQFEGLNSPQTPKKTLEDSYPKGNINNRLLKDSEDSSEARTGTKRAPVKDAWKKWTEAVETRDLNVAEHIHQLCQIAARLGIVRQDDDFDRSRIFVAAANQLRVGRNGAGRSLNALFRSNVYQNRWYGNQKDENVGRDQMRRAEVFLRCSSGQAEADRCKRILAQRLSLNEQESRFDREATEVEAIESSNG